MSSRVPSCKTLHCNLPLGHGGPCSTVLSGKRKRVESNHSQFMKISEAANTKQPRSKAKSKQAKPSRRTKPAAASREQEPPSSHPPAAGRSTRAPAGPTRRACAGVYMDPLYIDINQLIMF